MVLTSPRVLVADDDPLIGRAVSRFLSRFSVDVVASGTEALERLDAGAYDMVLLDLDLGDMLGADVVARISAETPERLAKVVFMTGGAHQPENAALLARLDNLVLRKPFLPDTLEDLIDDFGLTDAEPQT